MKTNKAYFIIEDHQVLSIEKLFGIEKINTSPQWQIQTIFKNDLVESWIHWEGKSFSLHLADDTIQRCITGIINSVSLDQDQNLFLNLSAQLNLLSFYFNNEVFANKSLKEICLVLLKKIYKNTENIYFDPSCQYPILPVIFKYQEDDFSFFKKILSMHQFGFYVYYNESGKECIYIGKNLLAQKNIILNYQEGSVLNPLKQPNTVYTLSKESSLQNNQEIQERFKFEAFCFLYPLGTQVHIYTEEKELSLFITKQNYELDLINQNAQFPLCVKSSFYAQNDKEIKPIDPKFQTYSPQTLLAEIDGDQIDLPDLDEEGRYKVWIPSFQKASETEAVKFKAHLLHNYLGKDSGMQTGLLKTTQVILQWTAFDPPIIIACLAPTDEKSLVTANNPQELYLKHSNISQCLFAKNTCHLNTSFSLLKCSSQGKEQSIDLQARHLTEASPDKKDNSIVYKETVIEIEEDINTYKIISTGTNLIIQNSQIKMTGSAITTALVLTDNQKNNKEFVNIAEGTVTFNILNSLTSGFLSTNIANKYHIGTVLQLPHVSFNNGFTHLACLKYYLIAKKVANYIKYTGFLGLKQIKNTYSEKSNQCHIFEFFGYLTEEKDIEYSKTYEDTRIIKYTRKD